MAQELTLPVSHYQVDFKASLYQKLYNIQAHALYACTAQLGQEDGDPHMTFFMSQSTKSLADDISHQAFNTGDSGIASGQPVTERSEKPREKFPGTKLISILQRSQILAQLGSKAQQFFIVQSITLNLRLLYGFQHTLGTLDLCQGRHVSFCRSCSLKLVHDSLPRTDRADAISQYG
jgi:hypothetical protein